MSPKARMVRVHGADIFPMPPKHIPLTKCPHEYTGRKGIMQETLL